MPTTSNIAPTVTLTDPQSGTAFTSGSTIVIDASASDSDGIISKVDFYQGTTLLGTDTSSPYTFAWSNVAGGTYSLTAKATDDNGALPPQVQSPSTFLHHSGLHSLSLNGTSSYVSVPNSSTINISGPITVEAWIKLNSVNGNYQDIVCREAWGQAGTGGGYELSITNTGKVRLDLYQSHNQYTTAIGSHHSNHQHLASRGGSVRWQSDARLSRWCVGWKLVDNQRAGFRHERAQYREEHVHDVLLWRIDR